MHTRSGRVLSQSNQQAGRRFGTNLNNQTRDKRGAGKTRKKKGLGRPSRASVTVKPVKPQHSLVPVVEKTLVSSTTSLEDAELAELLKATSGTQPELDLDEDDEGPSVMNMSLDEVFVENVRESLIDIDAYDENDTQSCTEYVNDIYKHLRGKELEFPIDSEYMTSGTQPDLSPNMRKILLDWLFDVHLKFKLLNDTIWMTVDVVDRFLAKKEVSRRKLQLVGVTAMLIASKYEEIYAPEVRDFVYICDNAYSRVEILEMERMMLNTLNFEVCNPTSLHFLRRFSKAARSDSLGHTLSKYLLEVSLQEYTMIRHKPSLLAAASVYLGRNMMESEGRFHWGSTMKYYTNYSESDVIECAREMAGFIRRLQTRAETKCTAVYRKYTNRFFGVAKIELVDI